MKPKYSPPMYGGTEYQCNWNSQRGSNTSIEGKKHPYFKRDFWKNPTNHFWESDNYTEKGKEMCRKWVKSLRPTFEYKETNLK